MKAAPVQMPRNRGVWVRATASACFSAASAFAYLAHMAQAVLVGALIGLPGREQDIAAAQQRSTCWLVVSLSCQSIMIAAITPLIPFASDEKPVTRFIVCVIFAAVVSLPLTLLVGVVMFAVSAGLHRLFMR